MKITRVTAKEAIEPWITDVPTNFTITLAAGADWNLFWLGMFEGTTGDGLCDFGKRVFSLCLGFGGDGTCRCDCGPWDLNQR